MIAVVAEPGPLRDAVVAALGDEAVAVDPGDPAALVSSLGGVERMFLACDDPVVAADAVAAAEMALVYQCVSLRPLDALAGTAMRSAVLLDDASGPYDVDEVAARAVRALTEPAAPP